MHESEDVLLDQRWTPSYALRIRLFVAKNWHTILPAGLLSMPLAVELGVLWLGLVGYTAALWALMMTPSGVRAWFAQAAGTFARPLLGLVFLNLLISTLATRQV